MTDAKPRTVEEIAEDIAFRYGHNPNWGKKESALFLKKEIQQVCDEVRAEVDAHYAGRVKELRDEFYAQGFSDAREKAANYMRDHGCTDCEDRIRALESDK